MGEMVRPLILFAVAVLRAEDDGVLFRAWWAAVPVAAGFRRYSVRACRLCRMAGPCDDNPVGGGDRGASSWVSDRQRELAERWTMGMGDR